MTPRRRSSFTLTSALALSLTTALALCASLSAHCTSNCATYAVSVVALDESTGALLCDAVVRFGSGAGDAGALLGGSAASSDAEAPATSASCQWDTVVGGGTYSVDVTAPGFAPASATLDLAKDQCGTANVPVTVRMTHSGS